MPFSRPTLDELQQQVAADIVSALPGADANMRFGALNAISQALAGLAHEHYGYLDWTAKQATPYTADDEYLEAWGALRGVFRKAATQASGTVRFIGTDGTTLDPGLIVQTGDGSTFTTTTGGTVAAGVVTVTAQADIAGATGNIGAGTKAALAVVVPGVQTQGVAMTTFTGGADAETDDEYRPRVMAAFQTQPQGGSKADFEGWALALPGITRAWCLPKGFGIGTTVVYVMLDDAQAAYGGFPQGTDGVAADEPRSAKKATGDQLAVANALWPLQPVAAQVWVCAPIEKPVNFVISGIPSSTTSQRSTIAAAISDVFKRIASPDGTAVPLSEIESAIAAIPGTSGFVVLSPAGNILSPVGYLATLGTLTFQ